MSTPFFRNFLILVCTAVCVLPASAQDKKKGKKAPAAAESAQSASREVLRVLDETIETKDFQNPMRFSEGIALLSDKLAARGKDLSIQVNEAAFKEENPDATDIMETPIQFRPFPRVMRVRAALEFMLEQVATRNAAFLIRKDGIEITTQRRAALPALLRLPVMGVFEDRPLAAAVDELAGQTGATIVIDARVAEKARTPVSAVLRRSITLENAVTLLVQMADLRAVVEDDVLFITSPREPAKKDAKGARLELKNRRLDGALRDVAELTGTTIVLDPSVLQEIRAADDPKGPRGAALAALADESEGDTSKFYRVTVTFPSNVKALPAARLLAAMTNLQVMEFDDLLYVTSPSGAAYQALLLRPWRP